MDIQLSDIEKNIDGIKTQISKSDIFLRKTDILISEKYQTFGCLLLFLHKFLFLQAFEVLKWESGVTCT